MTTIIALSEALVLLSLNFLCVKFGQLVRSRCNKAAKSLSAPSVFVAFLKLLFLYPHKYFSY